MTKSIEKKAESGKFDRTMRGLLRSPKTRPGLVSAAVEIGLTANSVYGWLAGAVRAGFVVKFKSTNKVLYSLEKVSKEETPRDGNYPLWLDPRALPPFIGRAVHLSNDQEDEQTEQEQEEERVQNELQHPSTVRPYSFADSVQAGRLGC